MKLRLRCEKFIDFLSKLKKDKAAMARLRRCINPSLSYEGIRYIAPFMLDEGNTWINRCFVASAAIFAEHQEHTPKMTFGECLRHVLKNESQVRRFTTFLKSKNDAAFYHARQLVALCKDQSLNWSELLYGLCCWNSPKKWVQNKFAYDFWPCDQVNKEEDSAEDVLEEESNEELTEEGEK